MRGRPVDELVYDRVFPKPKSTDPPNFGAFLQRNLIPEVRHETHAFYGHLDTQEAKYPGLDYTHNTHRIRLSRWPWHRRLFRAFNALGLTNAEIASLTKWEGTKWAKDKYEREQGITIRDTTADGFPDWVEPMPGQDLRADRVTPALARSFSASPAIVDAAAAADDDDDDDDDADTGDESDEELDSLGVQLNERLRAEAARREAGETSAVLDEEWEQWLKYAIETGELAIITEHMTERMVLRGTTSSSLIPAALIPPSMLSAARSGHWSEIPDYLQPVLRRVLDPSDRPSEPPPPAGSSRRQTAADDSSRTRVPWSRRTYSQLRLPSDESVLAAQMAHAPGA